MDMTRSSDGEGVGDSTSMFRADLLGDEPSPHPAPGAPDGVEGLPPRFGLIVVRRGPNAGARFLLDQAISSVGRHPDSDIFLDDPSVSRRHAEIRHDGASFMVADVWSYLEHERLELADFLETLTPAEWEVQSLCSEWKVRDVAAHLCAIGELRHRWWTLSVALPSATMARRLAKSGFRVDRFSAEDGRTRGAESPAAIIARLRELAPWKEHPPGMPKVAPLADILVHNHDIRRPLGKPRAMPAESFALAAPLFTRIGVGALYFRSRKRVGGLRLVADDIDWSAGDGPEVRGSAEAILLVLANRAVGPDELTGEGADQLYGRLRAGAN